MSERLFERVAIVGPGLIGGSLGMALRRRGLAGRVLGVGHRQISMDKALECGAVDEASIELPPTVADADLVVLATSVGKILEQIPTVVSEMKAGAVLTDVGSVKGAICRAARSAIAKRENCDVRFVGSHPLAGSEQRGIDAAREDLFDGALCIMAETGQGDPDREAFCRVESMWKGVGCEVRALPAEEHDRLLGEISHLPHAAAAGLVNSVGDEALDLAASGFLDTTRVASGDPDLWVDIFLANRDGVLPALHRMQTELSAFIQGIESSDAAALRDLLRAARDRRDRRLKEA